MDNNKVVIYSGLAFVGLAIVTATAVFTASTLKKLRIKKSLDRNIKREEAWNAVHEYYETLTAQSTEEEFDVYNSLTKTAINI